MAKNIDWKEIAKMIDVEIGEPFRIQIPSYFEDYIDKVNDKYDLEIMDFCIYDDGLALTDEYSFSGNYDEFFYDIILGGILQDNIVIKRKRFKPKDGETYYYVDIEEGGYTIVSAVSNEGYLDCINFMNGNCFKTYDEAKAKVDELYKEFTRKIDEMKYEYI